MKQFSRASTRVTTSMLVVLFCVTLLALAPSALAVDGVVLINQNTTVNGLPGCASTGFPIVVCRPGSYRLSGNLTIPDANTSGIQITADNVTLDLNGFTIAGPVTCRPFTYPLQCTAAGNGVGITNGASTVNNITVRNGTVRGMGNAGIRVRGGYGVLVEDVHVANIGPGPCTPPIEPEACGIGIDLSGRIGAVVTRCTIDTSAGDGIVSGDVIVFSTVELNGGNGIAFANAVADCMVSYNGETGIYFGSNVKDNTVQGNVGVGLYGVEGYRGNIILGNRGGSVYDGFSLGGNQCDGGAC